MNAKTKLRAPERVSKPKLFVLDTNVLMHDPTCLFSFEEHDVFLPIVTLEELDEHKKGTTEVARNVRHVTRFIDELLEGSTTGIKKGVSLSTPSNGKATGLLFLQVEEMNGQLPQSFPKSKNDHQILSVVTHLKNGELGNERDVILVTKDLNMRIKARVLGVAVQDYLSDKVVEDADLLHTGMIKLPDDFWEKHSDRLHARKEHARSTYHVHGPFSASLHVNSFVYHEETGFNAMVNDASVSGAMISTVTDFGKSSHAVWGITARNREQNFALNLLMNPDIDFVTLVGPAGTGKTLLTLAVALHMTLDENRFSEIIMTRVTVPVGEDIGFLPGTEEEKMTPWMGALEDNLDVLSPSASETVHKENGAHKPTTSSSEWSKSVTRDLIRSRLKVKSLNFMRGRTFLNKFLIIDEAQNLTPKQMKTLITRAGPGTKVVCLGNLGQIDTPYLSEGSSGLAYVVERFKGWEHGGHIILTRGERSRLADHANEVL